LSASKPGICIERLNEEIVEVRLRPASRSLTCPQFLRLFMDATHPQLFDRQRSSLTMI